MASNMAKGLSRSSHSQLAAFPQLPNEGRPPYAMDEIHLFILS